VGKQRSGYLHTVAGVAGKSDDDVIDVFNLGRCGSGGGCLGCHWIAQLFWNLLLGKLDQKDGQTVEILLREVD